MMPLYVHSQEEYTCDWVFNSIPQTGLKTEIFEILGEPDELWEPNEDPVQIGIYHDDTIYDTGRSYSRTYIFSRSPIKKGAVWLPLKCLPIVFYSTISFCVFELLPHRIRM